MFLFFFFFSFSSLSEDEPPDGLCDLPAAYSFIFLIAKRGKMVYNNATTQEDRPWNDRFQA